MQHEGDMGQNMRWDSHKSPKSKQATKNSRTQQEGKGREWKERKVPPRQPPKA